MEPSVTPSLLRSYSQQYYQNFPLIIGQRTLPWAIFRFQIFLNYFLQKFEKIKIMVWKSDNLTILGEGQNFEQ